MQGVRFRQAASSLLAWFAIGCASASANSATVTFATEHGVGLIVTAPMDKAARSAIETFRDLDIQLTEVEVDDDVRRYSGTSKEREVTAELKRQPAGLTQVEVIAKMNAASLDKTFAQKILVRIADKLD